MKIEKFSNQYKPVIDSWLKEYQMVPCDWTVVPPNCFIAIEDKDCLAFNYFYRSDVQNMGVMGVTIANPNISKEKRDDALDMITAHLLKEVETCGIKYFFYFAEKNPIVNRMKSLGFEQVHKEPAYILLKTFDQKGYWEFQ
jgi:hypothetical protein